MKREVAIIGGGAAGIVAAIVASRNGAKVVIYERMNRIGKKILATGNGRCNLTNIGLGENNLNCIHGSNNKFAGGILKQFTVKETIDFFEVLGIAHKIEEGGKVFPMSDQATSVLDVLRYELEKLGVEVICDIEIEQIKQDAKKITLVDKSGSRYKADKVIIATGGMSSPNLGSNGSGYQLAKQLGHSVIKPFPALVQLKLEAPFLKSIKGIKFDGVASIILNNKLIRKEEGELLFTEYGISGPPVLQLSRKAVEALQNKKQPKIVLDMLPKYSHSEVIELLNIRLSHQYDRPFDFSFNGLINKKLIPIVLKAANIKDLSKQCSNVSNKEIEKVASILKEWEFDITGSQSWQSSQVTAGGVHVGEICEDTLQSKFVPNIYFAGELLDIDGDCGGFNLQWAWSSGYVAGHEASI